MMQLRRSNSLLPILLLIVIGVGLAGCIDLESLKRELDRDRTSSSESLSVQTISRGLKEALRVASARASDQASVTGGYLNNAQIKIPLPDELRDMAKTLRRLGLDEQVDELEVALNRAAELAATEAKPIFINAIKSLTIEDVVGIYKGDDSAATRYFERKTSSDLSRAFSPIVNNKLQQTGLARIYADLTARYNALPFVKKPALDLGQYVTAGSLKGLFHLLAGEEAQIRRNPVARTTELLKTVFGS